MLDLRNLLWVYPTQRNNYNANMISVLSEFLCCSYQVGTQMTDGQENKNPHSINNMFLGRTPSLYYYQSFELKVMCSLSTSGHVSLQYVNQQTHCCLVKKKLIENTKYSSRRTITTIGALYLIDTLPNTRKLTNRMEEQLCLFFN